LDLTVGSLEGDGLVFLGSKQLTVGTNNLNTTFSGVIQDGGIGGGSGGSLVKIGTGSLTLTGGNTYTGSTLVSTGALLVKNTTGSATGTGAVQINGGILGGGGIISGPVTIGMVGSGTGGSVQPGQGSSNPTTLTLQNTLTFQSDGNYTCKLNSKKAKADQVIASGVTIESGAQFDINIVGNKKLSAGKVFTAISNTAATAISGTFDNLADGSTVTLGINRLEASYSGGDGNDLTLTVVP
jgi:autotransporter-associated beta strand protein